MGHGGGALLPLAEIFLRLQHLGPLQMPDLGGQPLHRACHHSERGEILRVAVARDHLRGDRLWLQPELLRHIGLHAGVDMGEGAHGAGDGAGAHLLLRRLEPFSGASELRIGISELEPEGGGLGMDAVAAPDRGGVLVLEGARFERSEQAVDIGNEQVRGLD